MNTKRDAKNKGKGVWRDVRAVSPVVAVLILIIVAVIGAVAIGGIETELIKRGEAEADFSEIGVKTIKLVGEPGVEPLMRGIEGASVAEGKSIIKAFEAEHPKIAVDFTRESSGFAMYALSEGVSDLGIGRRFPTDAELTAYQNLKSTVVGKAPIAVIVHNESGDFRYAYTGIGELDERFISSLGGPDAAVVYPTENTENGGIKPVGEVYGTSIQGMFSLYLMRGPEPMAWAEAEPEEKLELNKAIDANPDNYVIVNTQEEAVAKVAENSGYIGFVNYGVACDAIDRGEPIVIVALDGQTEAVGPEGTMVGTGDDGIDETDTTAARRNIGMNDDYVTGFGGPMFTPIIVFSNGDPDPTEQELINFMLSSEGVEIQRAHGFLAGEDIAVTATSTFNTA